MVLFGTVATAACLLAFGFCRTLWQAILVQVLMGLLNGNQGVISTCLGEITDRTNQSKAFTYLPVIYGLGGITGPVVGGLLVFKDLPWKKGVANPFPYLPPNLLSCVILLIDAGIAFAFLEESLEEAKELPPLTARVENFFTWVWQFSGFSTKPSYVRRARKTHEAQRYDGPRSSRSGTENSHERDADVDEEHEDDDDDDVSSEHSESDSLLADESTLSAKMVFNRDTLLLLITFLIFQLGNISYNSLYPIFGQTKPPTGRGLTPEENGLSLGFAGVITILFQIGVFGKLRDKIGNKVVYRAGFAGLVIAFLLMPFVGYKDGKNGFGNPTQNGKVILYIELGVVLIIKTVAAVGCLTSALLLITNSAPNHAVLGSLNGLAQTLSAGGRAAGPFIAGSLFTASTHVRPKGEALAFGTFAGISFVGFLLSFGIRGANLEADDLDSESGSESDSDDGDDDEERHPR